MFLKCPKQTINLRICFKYVSSETNIRIHFKHFSTEPNIGTLLKFVASQSNVRTHLSMLLRTQWKNTLKYFSSTVLNTPSELRPPTKAKTPYGLRITWIMPGRNLLVVHLKDSLCIRNKKRWSQVINLMPLSLMCINKSKKK